MKLLHSTGVLKWDKDHFKVGLNKHNFHSDAFTTAVDGRYVCERDERSPKYADVDDVRVPTTPTACTRVRRWRCSNI